MKRTLLLLLAACLSPSAWCDVSLFPLAAHLDAADRAWSEDRWLDARNEWTRALEWNRLGREIPEGKARELAAMRDEAERRWIATLSVTPPIVDIPREETPVKRRRARRREAEPRVEPVSVDEILARARAARQAGQLESALRLFRIAERRPGGGAAATEAAEIEREIGAQPER